jgi:hypothetical protein
MLRFAGIGAALFAVSVVSTVAVGPNLLALAVFPVPVAICLVRRWPKGAAALVVTAAASGFVALVGRWALNLPFDLIDEVSFGQAVKAGASAAVYYGVVSLLGVPLGIGFQRRWSYGTIVWAVSAIAIAVMLAQAVLAWDRIVAETDFMFESWNVDRLKKAEQAGTTVEESEQEQLNWFREHAMFLRFGVLAGLIFGMACMLVSTTASGMRRWFGEPGPQGSFVGMRPPEWLVWLAIVTAVACIAEQYWPNDTVKLLAWNTALALLAVYWLNGLGIFLYGVQVLQPNLLVFMLLVFLLVWGGTMMPVLAALGFSDIWIGMRNRIDAWSVALEARRDGDDGPA